MEVRIGLTDPLPTVEFIPPKGIKLGQMHKDFLAYLSARGALRELIGEKMMPDEAYTPEAKEAIVAIAMLSRELLEQRPGFWRQARDLQHRGIEFGTTLFRGSQPLKIAIFQR